MAYEEVKTGNGGDFEDRERVNVKIGVTLEGTFRRASKLMESKFGGDVRYVDLDSVDGRKLSFAATKILLERLDAARPQDGDMLKIVVKAATSKAGRTYADPKVYIDRGAAPAASVPEQAELPSAADEEVPF